MLLPCKADWKVDSGLNDRIEKLPCSPVPHLCMKHEDHHKHPRYPLYCDIRQGSVKHVKSSFTAPSDVLNRISCETRQQVFGYLIDDTDLYSLTQIAASCRLFAEDVATLVNLRMHRLIKEHENLSTEMQAWLDMVMKAESEGEALAGFKMFQCYYYPELTWIDVHWLNLRHLRFKLASVFEDFGTFSPGSLKLTEPPESSYQYLQHLKRMYYEYAQLKIYYRWINRSKARKAFDRVAKTLISWTKFKAGV